MKLETKTNHLLAFYKIRLNIEQMLDCISLKKRKKYQPYNSNDCWEWKFYHSYHDVSHDDIPTFLDSLPTKWCQVHRFLFMQIGMKERRGQITKRNDKWVSESVGMPLRLMTHWRYRWWWCQCLFHAIFVVIKWKS